MLTKHITHTQKEKKNYFLYYAKEEEKKRRRSSMFNNSGKHPCTFTKARVHACT